MRRKQEFLSRYFQIDFLNSFDTLETRPLAKLSYRLGGPVASITILIETTSGIGNLSLIPSMTPRNRVLYEFQHSRPNQQNNQFQVVILVVTLQQIMNNPQQQ